MNLRFINRNVKLDSVRPYLSAGRSPEELAAARDITLSARGRHKDRYCTLHEAFGWGQLSPTIWGALLSQTVTVAELDEIDDLNTFFLERAKALPSASGMVDFRELCSVLGIKLPWALSFAAFAHGAGLDVGDYVRLPSTFTPGLQTVLIPEDAAYVFILSSPGERAAMVRCNFNIKYPAIYQQPGGWLGHIRKMLTVSGN